MSLRTSVLGLLVLSGIPNSNQAAFSDESGKIQRVNIGPTSDGRIVVPTNQVLTPAGRQVLFPGRPSDVVLSPEKRLLAVLSHKEVLTINTESGEISGRIKISGASYKGIVFTPDGAQLLVSTSVSAKTAEKEGVSLRIIVESNGDLEAGEPISLKHVVNTDAADSKDTTLSADGVTRYGANQLPAGMAVSADGKLVCAAINMANQLVEIDLATNPVVRQFPVGNAPYDVVLAGDKAYVSNFAGRVPSKDDTTGAAGHGAAVKVDPVRHIASEGSVSVVDLATGKVAFEILVGLHASSISVTPDGRFVIVANADSDTMGVIDVSSNEVVETISTQPNPDLPFSRSPNAHVFSPDGNRLYVSNGTNNAIAVFDFAPPMTTLKGLIPTVWYPAGLAIDTDRNSIYVANLKGIGSRDTGRKERGKLKAIRAFVSTAKTSMVRTIELL